MAESLERVVADLLGGMLQHFSEAIATQDAARNTLRELGVEGADADSIANYLSSQAAQVSKLETDLPNVLTALESGNVEDAVLPLADLVSAVMTLASNAPPVVPASALNVGNVLDYLLSTALDATMRTLNPTAWAFLRGVNLIGPEVSVADTFTALFTKPISTIWDHFKSERRNATITVTGLVTGVRTTSIITNDASNANIAPEIHAVLPSASITISQIVLALAADTFDTPQAITFALYGDGASPPNFAGLAITTDPWTTPLRLGDALSLTPKPANAAVGLAVTNWGKAALIAPSSPGFELGGDFSSLAWEFGSDGGLHITLAEPILDLTVGLSTSGAVAPSWGAKLGLGRFEIVIPNDVAGPILGLLLPSGGIDMKGKLLVSFDDHGVHLDGGAGFSTTWPETINLPGVSIYDLTTDITVGATISLAAYGTIAISLGPIGVTIEGLGITQQLAIRGDGSGNLGLLDLPVPALRPPNGVGVSIDATVLKGGGFLAFNGDEISGALELALALGPIEISVHAIAIFGEVDGAISFLVIIAVEFTPAIELFMGLTLNGVGGVFGLNRTLNPDALGDLVRSGRMNDLMFPQDLAARAPAIIDEARKIYPARRDQFVVGPMLKLGWGEPVSFVTLSVGIVFTFPDPVIVAIIGNLNLVLPAEELAIIELNCSFDGGLNFTTGDVWFDASLERSHIGMFDVTGDLCLRAGSIGFVFSVGGFHPKFTPPPGIPALKRLAISLAPFPILSIRAEAYFALTGSTVQFGAHVYLLAELGPISVDGEIGLDVLIQTSPKLHFTAEISGHFHLRFEGEEICGADVDVLLEGPGLWHAHATASIHLLFFKVSGTIDVDWGSEDAEQRPAIDPAAVVHAALSRPDGAWPHVIPAADAGIVHVRRGASALHPLGSIRLSQTAAPLDVALDRYGANPVTSKDPVKLTVTATGVGTPAVSQDLFAAGQFFKMTDDEKLGKPSFVPLDSGYVLAGDSWRMPTAAQGLLTVDIEYEESTRDDPPGTKRGRNAMLATSLGWSVTSAAGAGKDAQVNPAPKRGISVTDVTYAVANAATGAVVAPGAVGVGEQAWRTSMVQTADHVAMATYELAVL